MKKICFIIPPGLPVPDIKGGAIETLVTELIDVNEIEKNFKFIVICKYDHDAIKYQKKYQNTKFININSKKISICQKILFKASAILRKLFKIYIPIINDYNKQVNKYLKENAENIELIINESNDFYALNYIKNQYDRKKIIAHFHYEVCSNRYLENIYGHTISVSKYIENRWAKNLTKNKNSTTTILNGIDLKKFEIQISIEEKEEIRKQLNFKNDDFVLLFCGRIVPQKGIKEIIQAVVNTQDKNIKLLIVGSTAFTMEVKSQYENEIKHLADKHKGIISFTGFINNNMLYKYQNIADVQVVPSIYEEPCGLVCIEAMVNGLPVIASNSGGIWEYLSEEYSIKVDKNTNFVDNLTKAILYAKTNIDEMKEKAQKGKIYGQKFSKEAFYKQFKEFIYKYTGQVGEK